MIENGSEVRIHYRLKVDGDIVQSTEGKEPLSYIHGSGQIIPKLENELEGLKPGDRKDVEIPPEQAYGPWNPEAVRKVSKSAFRDPESLEVGGRVTGEAAGQQFQASITELGDEEVTLDLNHPLAGKTLEFDVEVVQVK